MAMRCCRRFVYFFFAIFGAELQSVGAVIDVDTVIGPDHPYNDQAVVVVNGVAPPTNVTLLDGAHLGYPPSGPFVPIGLEAFGQSEILMLGGGISGSEHAVVLHDTSRFHMVSGGFDLRGIDARDGSQVVLDGGS